MPTHSLVFKQNDRPVGVKLSTTLHPHIILVPDFAFYIIRFIRIVIINHLYRCFIALIDQKLQKLFVKQFIKWKQIFFCASDRPVSHCLTGYIYAVPLKLLFNPIQQH